MISLPSAQALLLFSLPLWFTVAAGDSGASCDPSYSWYFWASNTMGQDPCIIANKLLATCPNIPTVGLLTNTSSYPGPTTDSQNPCSCSYVIYNLLSACSDCQVGNRAPGAWPSYPSWAVSCSPQNQVTVFPNNVPSDTEIPTWATVNVSVTGDVRWSYGVSYALARGNIDLTGKSEPNPTTIASSGAVSTRSINLPPAQSSPQSPNSSGSDGQGPQGSLASAPSHKNLAGPIAGSVIGGFAAGVLLTALVSFLWFRKVRDHKRPSVLLEANRSEIMGSTSSAAPSPTTAQTVISPYIYQPVVPQQQPVYVQTVARPLPVHRTSTGSYLGDDLGQPVTILTPTELTYSGTPVTSRPTSILDPSHLMVEQAAANNAKRARTPPPYQAEDPVASNSASVGQNILTLTSA